MTQLPVHQQFCKFLTQCSCVNLSQAALKLGCKKSRVKDYQSFPSLLKSCIWAQSLRPFLSYAAATGMPSFAAPEPDLQV